MRFKAGSVVQLVESKPISRNKRWVVEKVLEGPGGRVLEPIVGEIVVDEEEEAEVPAEVPEVAESSVEVEAPAEVPELAVEPAEAEAPTEVPEAPESTVESDEAEESADDAEADEEIKS